MAISGFKALGQGQVTSAGADALTAGTVPASHEYAIREIALINTQSGGGTVLVDIYRNVGSADATKLWKHVALVGQYAAWEWEGSMLLATGERIWIKADVNNVVNYVVSGLDNQ